MNRLPLRTALLALILTATAGLLQPVAAQDTVIFEDSFENGEFDSNHWTARPSLEGASGGRLEVSGGRGNARTGSFAVLMGRDADGEVTTNALDLRLDLSGRDQVELRFWLRDFFNEEVEGDGIYFSDDGGATFTSEPVFCLVPGCGGLSCDHFKTEELWDNFYTAAPERRKPSADPSKRAKPR